jgi:hypothetical protein
MSASRTGVKLGVAAAAIALLGGLIAGVAGRVRDAADRTH